MRRTYWVKWENEPPVKWYVVNIEEFWNRLREEFLRHPRILEWMILDE